MSKRQENLNHNSDSGGKEWHEFKGDILEVAHVEIGDGSWVIKR